MRLPGDLGQLTYCTNVHPAETLGEVMAAIDGPAAAVGRAVAPDADFALGLRLSAATVAELDRPEAVAGLRERLDAHRFRAVTVNGFPYGPFHGTSVKQEVYQPDWRRKERLDYTLALAEAMVALAPDGEVVTLSTVPGTYRPLGAGAEPQMAEAILQAVAGLVALRERTGVTVALALEPEPFCFLETVADAVAFFRGHLHSDAAVAGLARRAGLSRGAAAAALQRHLGLCYDVCHAAIAYEDAAGSLAALREAGIPVLKLQLSSALRVPHVDAAAQEALGSFVEPTYLHQVIARRGDVLARVPDLPEALARGEAADGEEWRVHFHVPVFAETAGPFLTTRDFLEEVLAIHRKAPVAPHLEIETYTWNVLPEGLGDDDLASGIARELAWVRSRLTGSAAGENAEAEAARAGGISPARALGAAAGGAGSRPARQGAS